MGARRGLFVPYLTTLPIKGYGGSYFCSKHPHRLVLGMGTAILSNSRIYKVQRQRIINKKGVNFGLFLRVFLAFFVSCGIINNNKRKWALWCWCVVVGLKGWCVGLKGQNLAQCPQAVPNPKDFLLHFDTQFSTCQEYDQVGDNQKYEDQPYILLQGS